MSMSLFSRMASAPSIRTALSSPSIHSRSFTSLINRQLPTAVHQPTTSHHHHHHNLQFSTAAKKYTPTPPKRILATGPDGTQYLIPLHNPLGNDARRARNAPKLAPSLARRRTDLLRTATGKLNNIRHSPWRLNLICQFAATHPTVADTLVQLTFTEKVKAETVRKLIAGVADNARSKYGLVPSQLEVAECFSTHGTPLKRIEFMGRGRLGRKQHRHAHIRVVIREIDFPLKILQARTRGGREEWVRKMGVAEEDYRVSREEGEELEKLEREVKEMQRAKQQEEADKKK